MKLRTYFQAAVALTLLHARPLAANVRLPAIISDHMVLQRGVAVPVWGWAEPGEQVSVSFAGQEKTAMPDATGKWMLKLDPLASGEPQALVVKGKNTITVQDVLVGEVWLGGGQSNMDFALGWQGEENLATVATVNDSQLRYFDVPHKGSLQPETDVVARWQVATPPTVKGWSAVCTYFGKNLREKLGVPVGMIKSAYGGTPAAPWVSSEALSRDPAWKEKAEKEIAATRNLPADWKAFPIEMAKWNTANGATDPGNTGLAKGWARPDFADSSWKEIDIPSQVGQSGLKGGGILWYRKSFPLPASAAAKDFDFDPGWINDGAITLYFNGTELKTTAPLEKFAKIQPRYHVPKELVRPGQANTLAVRLHALVPGTNWGAPISRMNLPIEDAKALDNKWKYQIEAQFPPPSPAAIAALPKTPTAKMEQTSTALFNAMINPLLPYAIKGCLWYQGEANTNPAELALNYRKLLPALITDWRTRWGLGDFPFYIVQLPNFGAARPQPSEGNWAILRESQTAAAAAVPHTGLAVAIDIGMAENIHPHNKKEVGRRLTLLALNRTYGEKVEDSGPFYDSMKIEGDAIRISFKEVGGGLEAKGGPLKTFAIAGADKKYVWADAKIDGETVLVSSPQVASPVSVRYAWADNPEGCNLYNKAGLPASPFRTDAP